VVVVTGILLLLTAGCGSPNLTKATSTYAAAAHTATDELELSAAVVTRLCHHSMELQYLTARLIPHSTVANLQQYGETQFGNAAQIGTITWNQRCEGLSRAEHAFDAGLAVIARYAEALYTFSGKDTASKTDIAAAAKAAVDDVAELSPVASDYKDKLEGIGGPLGSVATSVEGAWKARGLRAVVTTTNEPLSRALGMLDDFVGVARERHVKDARDALSGAVMALDDARGSGDVSLDLLATRLDIEESERLDALDRKLVIMSNILRGLMEAHAQLAGGWQQGEKKSGAATLKAMVALTKDLEKELRMLHATETVR